MGSRTIKKMIAYETEDGHIKAYCERCDGAEHVDTLTEYGHCETCRLEIEKGILRKGDKIYVIAHTWRDTDLTIEHFFSAHETTKRLSELVDNGFAINSTDPSEYISEYLHWIEEDNDNMADSVIALEIIEL